ncbi:cytidine deaminase [Bacillaceae bacterium SIJ1]|uniref:cytidine deaminase family protein n=1 Tax=Litoribacterium kuwaitense TaxID=1398745 RepID=UPI0013EA713B|nr:cytidine deaminase [Litoribacterium kuwaitense]NGP44167.1 cytidine deaminase [Litoribacterium kuwaitense]
MTFGELYKYAKSVVHPKRLSETAEAGGVGAALLSESGQVYTGICIDTACSLGFCAEHAAAAQMVLNAESRVVKMVAVGWNGNIYPPCGRCREFIRQLHDDNDLTKVLIEDDVIVALKDLLPYDWRHSS